MLWWLLIKSLVQVLREKEELKPYSINYRLSSVPSYPSIDVGVVKEEGAGLYQANVGTSTLQIQFLAKDDDGEKSYNSIYFAQTEVVKAFWLWGERLQQTLGIRILLEFEIVPLDERNEGPNVVGSKMILKIQWKRKERYTL